MGASSTETGVHVLRETPGIKWRTNQIAFILVQDIKFSEVQNLLASGRRS